MSSKEERLRIEPGFSGRLVIYLVLSHGTGIVAVMALPICVWLRLVLGLGVVIGLVHGFRSQVLRKGAFALRAVELDGVNGWSLYTAKGVARDASLLPSSFVRPWLTVLNFSVGRFGRRSVILLPDAVDGEILRRLRVRVRTAPPKQSRRSR